MIIAPFLDDMISFKDKINEHPIFQSMHDLNSWRLSNQVESLDECRGLFFIKCDSYWRSVARSTHPSHVLHFIFDPKKDNRYTHFRFVFDYEFEPKELNGDCLVLFIDEFSTVGYSRVVTFSKHIHKDDNPFKCFWNVTRKKWMGVYPSK